MTAPLFFLPPGTLAAVSVSSRVELDGAEGHHAARVRRVRPGEQVLLADGSGWLAHATVLVVQAGVVELSIDRLTEPSPARPRLVFAQALAKGGRDELAIEMATELGVDEVLAWQAERSVVVWRGDRGAKSLAKWEAVAAAAAKQARRADVPQVSGVVSTTGLAERARECVAGGGVCLVLHEESEHPLAANDLAQCPEILLVVGPEGGIGASELSAMTEVGARSVRLGPTVLRTSTAGPAALAILNARYRWT